MTEEPATHAYILLDGKGKLAQITTDGQQVILGYLVPDRVYGIIAILKKVTYPFAPGQEISEHTSAKPAILHFLTGEAELKLGDDQTTVQAGSWTYMQAHLPHSIFAKSQVIMLLYLL